MKQLKKKGQVMQNIAGLGIGVVALVLVLVIAFLVMANLNTQVISQGSTASEVMENVTVGATANTTAVAFGNAQIMEITSCVVSNASNATANLLTITEHYNCSPNGLRMHTGAHSLNGVAVNYTYRPKSAAYNGTGTLTNATATIPGWVPLIILVAIGGMILALVSTFRRR